MATSEVFSLAEVRDLARNPDLDIGLRRERNRAGGNGFSYPQERWLYGAACDYYESDRDPKKLRDTFRGLVAGRDRELTPWKQSVVREMGTVLDAFILLDDGGRGTFERSAFEYPPSVTTWRDHKLKVPIGLLVADGQEHFVRMLWMDHKLQATSRGVTLVVAATLVASKRLGTISGIETWHLREGERRFYPTDDLRHSKTRLDRVLMAAEGRLRKPPTDA